MSKKFGNFTIESIMSSPPVVVHKETSVHEAARIMFNNRIGSVLVVEDDGRLIGILTERDLVYLVASDKLHTASEMKVWHLMTENPITVKANETIGDALSKMKEVNIRHLPVVNDEGKPIGIVSMRDILDYIISFLDLSFH